MHHHHHHHLLVQSVFLSLLYARCTTEQSEGLSKCHSLFPLEWISCRVKSALPRAKKHLSVHARLFVFVFIESQLGLDYASQCTRMYLEATSFILRWAFLEMADLSFLAQLEIVAVNLISTTQFFQAVAASILAWRWCRSPTQYIRRRSQADWHPPAFCWPKQHSHMRFLFFLCDQSHMVLVKYDSGAQRPLLSR